MSGSPSERPAPETDHARRCSHDQTGGLRDGEFLSKFPTDDLHPGGDFSAVLPIKQTKK